jgi:tetratricopeptide (TPR) repeat protein
MRFALLGLTAVLGLAAVCSGQGMPGMAMHTIPAPEELPVPVKMVGIGNGRIAITATAEAQAWFDQGLNLYHDFWDYESTKAFEQGVRVDPNCAMCFWGLVQAEGFRGGPDSAYGKKALAAALKLKGRVSERERLYLLAAREESKGKKKPKYKSLRKLVKKYPEDLQARIFLAEALMDGYDDKGEPKAGSKQAIAMLEAVLKDAPNDSAANHYWIHAMEPSSHPERAIPSAALLASLAPTSGHMVHMPGHIYYRVGQYADGQRWFTASTEADEKYMREQKVGVDDDWNYVHNMQYSIANLMEQGRLQEANALSDKLSGARGELSATLYIWSARDDMARVSNRLPVALRVGDWGGVLAMLEGAPVKAGNLAFLAGELKEYALGMEALDAGKVADAEAASARLDAGLDAMKKKVDAKDAAKDKSKDDRAKGSAAPQVPVMPDAEAAPLVKEFTIASLELRGGIAIAKSKGEDGKKLFVDAAKKEKDLGYREPPFYIRPVGETEGLFLLKARDFAGAKAGFEAGLADRPASGFELYGLARVKEMSGDVTGAKAGYAAFLTAWPRADEGLPEVVHAKAVVSGGAVGAL